MRKIVSKSILFIMALAMFCAGFSAIFPARKIDDVAIGAGLVSSTTKTQLLSTEYVYQIKTIYSMESDANKWTVSGGNLGSTKYAKTADELIELIDQDRFNGSTYADCVLKFPNKFLDYELVLKHGKYYISAPSGSDSVALSSKTENASGDILAAGYYTDSELGTFPTLDSFEKPSKGICVTNDARLYIYDCEMYMIENLRTTGSAGIYLDNAQITMSTMYFYKRGLVGGGTCHELQQTSNFTVNGETYIVNGSTVSARVPEIDYFSTATAGQIQKITSQITKTKAMVIDKDADAFLADDPGSNTPSTYNNIVFTNYGYMWITSEMKINMTGYNKSYIITNYDELAIFGDPEFRNDGILQMGNDEGIEFKFNSTLESKGKIVGAYDLSKVYTITIDFGYSNGDAIVDIMNNSLSNFNVTGGYIGSYIDEDSTDADKLIATTKNSESGSYYKIIYQANYYHVTLYYTGRYGENKNLFVPAGQPISANYHGYEISQTLINNKNTGYTVTGWEQYATIRGSETKVKDYSGNIENVAPTMHGSISPTKTLIKYDILFDDASLKGANVDETYTNQTDITKVGSYISLPTIYQLDHLPDQERNWKFLGWSLSPDGELLAGNRILVTSENFQNIKLYAVYQKIWTIYFNHDMDIIDWTDGHGTVLDEVVFEYYILDGELVDTTPGIPQKYKYTFDYWYLTDESVEFDFANTPVTSNLTFNAKWNVIVYTVIFEKNTNADLSSTNWPTNQNVDALSKITQPDAVVANGYTFVRWYDADTLDTINFNATIAKNTRIRAEWSVNQYTITYTMLLPDGTSHATFAQGATYTSTITIESLGSINLPQKDDITGVPSLYKLTGWKLNGSGSTLTSFVATQDNYQELTFVAVFSEKLIEVVIHLNIPNTSVYILHEAQYAPIEFFSNSFTYNSATNTMRRTFTSSAEEMALPNCKDLYCSNGSYIIAHWYIGDSTGNQQLGIGYSINYTQAMPYIDGDDRVHIYANAEEAEIAGTVTYQTQITGVQNLEVEIVPYLKSACLFAVEDGELVLLKTYGITYISIPATALNIGVNRLMFVWVDGTFSFSAETTYEDLAGIPKLMKEFSVTVVAGVVTVPGIEIVYEYDGNPHTVYLDQIAYRGYDVTNINISSQTGVDAGEYSFILSLKNTTHLKWSDGLTEDRRYFWNISRKYISSLVDNIYEIYEYYEYNASPQTILVSQIISESYNVPVSAYELSGTWTATNAGIYEAELTLTKNYTFYCGTTLSFRWEIHKKQLNRILGGGSFEWDKDLVGTQIITIDYLYGGYMDNYGDYVTLGGQINMTDVGSYVTTITLKDPDNLEWAGGVIGFPLPGGGQSQQQDPLVDKYTWQITPKGVRLPSLSYRQGHFINQIPFVQYGNVQTAVYLGELWEFAEFTQRGLAVDMADNEYVGIAGTLVAIDAGSYTVEVSLKYGANTVWEDGLYNKYSSETLSVYWGISKAYLECPADPQIVNGVLVPNISNLKAGDIVLYLNTTNGGVGMGSFGGDYSMELPELYEGDNYISYMVIRANQNYEDYQGNMFVTYTPPVVNNDNNNSNSGNGSSAQTSEETTEDGGSSIVIIGAAVGAVIALGGVSLIIIKKKKRKI